MLIKKKPLKTVPFALNQSPWKPYIQHYVDTIFAQIAIENALDAHYVAKIIDYYYMSHISYYLLSLYAHIFIE